MANVHVTQESRSLRCDLTNVERLEKGRALAEADADCARIEEEKGRVAAQYAAQIKTATARRHELAGAIRQGYEFRDVLCRVQFVYPDREVVVAREDTGEVIERRGMNPTELRQAERRAQGDLFPEQEKSQEEPVMLAESDPDVQAAKAAENTDAAALGAGEADAPVDAQEHGEAAAEPTPAGEAASPAESEHQRKPRSDKGKTRGARKAHEPDARDPGFETPPVNAPSEPVNAGSGSVNENAGSVNGETDQAATANQECGNPDCGHLRQYHFDDTGEPIPCWQPGCECERFEPPRTPTDSEIAPEFPEEPVPAPPAAHSRACSVCGCNGYVGNGAPDGICRDCGHRADYHQGRGGAVDPLGLGAATRRAPDLDAMKDRLSGEGEAQP